MNTVRKKEIFIIFSSKVVNGHRFNRLYNFLVEKLFINSFTILGLKGRPNQSLFEFLLEEDIVYLNFSTSPPGHSLSITRRNLKFKVEY